MKNFNLENLTDKQNLIIAFILMILGLCIDGCFK